MSAADTWRAAGVASAGVVAPAGASPVGAAAGGQLSARSTTRRAYTMAMAVSAATSSCQVAGRTESPGQHHVRRGRKAVSAYTPHGVRMWGRCFPCICGAK
eukprot:999186-Prorocentrum_minimum.AAC.2